MVSSGREKALETTLSQIQKRFGEGALMRLGDAATLEVESISTGCISLDIALGIGEPAPPGQPIVPRTRREAPHKAFSMRLGCQDH